MFEMRQGSARLISALYSRKDDAPTIRRLAALLDYMPEQLQQDIQALSDFYQQTGKNEKVAEE